MSERYNVSIGERSARTLRTQEKSPEKLDAVIDTTPAWKPVVAALNNLRAGGRPVINAIRKEEREKNTRR